MTRNLTITIPDDLWDKIQLWRDQIPIARVCQKALSQEVSRLENLPQEVKEMSEVICRLRAEKKGIKSESYALGFEKGIKWAKQASYRDLVDWVETANMRGVILDSWILPEGENEVLDNQEDVDEAAYQRGWLDGVVKVWNIVQSKI